MTMSEDDVVKRSFGLKRLELVMVGHQPAKFGGHRHCGRRGITFEEQDPTCLLKSVITVNSIAHDMSFSHTSHFRT